MLQNPIYLDHDSTVVSENVWHNTPPVVQKLLNDVNEDHQALSGYLGEIHKNVSQNSIVMQYIIQKLTDLEVEQKKKESRMEIHFGKRFEKTEKLFKSLSQETHSLISNQLSEFNVLQIVDQKVSSRIEPLEKNQQSAQHALDYLRKSVEKICRDLRECKNESKELKKKVNGSKNVVSFRSELNHTNQSLRDKLTTVIESFEQQSSTTSTFIKNEMRRTIQNAVISLTSSIDDFTHLQNSFFDASTLLVTHFEHRDTVEIELGLNEKSSNKNTSLLKRIENPDESRRFQQKLYKENETNIDSQSKLRKVSDNEEIKSLESLYQEIDNVCVAMAEIGMHVDHFQKCIKSVNNDFSLLKREIKEVTLQKTIEKYPTSSSTDLQSKLVLNDDKQTPDNSVADSVESFITSKKTIFNSRCLKGRELSEFADSKAVENSQAPLQAADEGSAYSRIPASNVTKRICQLESENLALADQIKLLQEKVNNCCLMVSSSCPLNRKGLTDSSEINSHSEFSEIELLRNRVSSLEHCFSHWRPMKGTIENISKKIAELETNCSYDTYSEGDTSINLKIEPAVKQIKEDIQLIHERQNSTELKYQELKQLFNSLSQQYLLSSSEDKAKSNEKPIGEEKNSLTPSLYTNTSSGYRYPQMMKTVSAASFLEQENNECCRNYIDERLESMWLSFASLLARKKDLD